MTWQHYLVLNAIYGLYDMYLYEGKYMINTIIVRWLKLQYSSMLDKIMIINVIGGTPRHNIRTCEVVIETKDDKVFNVFNRTKRYDEELLSKINPRIWAY